MFLRSGWRQLPDTGNKLQLYWFSVLFVIFSLSEGLDSSSFHKRIPHIQQQCNQYAPDLTARSIPTSQLTNVQLPKSSIAKHIQRLISRWPSDSVRPASVSVQTYLQSRLNPPPAPTKQTGLFSSLFSKKPSASAPETSTSQDPPLLSTQNVNALYSLLENRYQREYPLARSLRVPKGQPEYYDQLLREFEEAPNRSWFGRIQKRVTGMLRLK